MQPQIIPPLPCDPKKTQHQHDDTHETHENHKLNTSEPQKPEVSSKPWNETEDSQSSQIVQGVLVFFLLSRILLTPPIIKRITSTTNRRRKQISTQPITTKKPSTINTISNQITNTTPIRKSPRVQFPSKPGITIPKR